MIGPELAQHFPGIDAAHDREHLIFHLTCTVLAACQHFHVPVRYSVVNAHRFCDRNYLAQWLSERDLKRAWLEGNNILFVGQLLVYLRDYERHPGAQAALEFWFSWLDNNVDRRTGLWGTDGFCTPAEAVYGGYHQLLVYFHEEHRIPNARGLVDTILALQHIDGSFSPSGNGGACEDVDCVDILVNIYKRNDYRRAQIRYALTQCADRILKTQNPDGGFSYSRDTLQSHMGIPDTKASANTSTAFATWFRIHTLALCAQIIPEHQAFDGIELGFSDSLSMGWHASPKRWKLEVSRAQRFREQLMPVRHGYSQLRNTTRTLGGKSLRALRLR